MTTALIGLGSNIEPEEHLLKGAQSIRRRFPHVNFSAVYHSKAVGMEGDDFLNACCLLSDVPEREQLIEWLKQIEDEHGRDRSEGSWKPRTLDLDLLVYDDEVLDDDLHRYAHVYVPAAELIPVEAPNHENSVVKKVELNL